MWLRERFATELSQARVRQAISRSRIRKPAVTVSHHASRFANLSFNQSARAELVRLARSTCRALPCLGLQVLDDVLESIPDRRELGVAELHVLRPVSTDSHPLQSPTTQEQLARCLFLGQEQWPTWRPAPDQLCDRGVLAASRFFVHVPSLKAR